MGLISQAYKQMLITSEDIRRQKGEYLFDILRANNRPKVWCIDLKCGDTNWGGFCRLHYRDVSCPPFRQNGGWFR